MPAPRKRFTTQKFATRPPNPLRTQNLLKSLGTLCALPLAPPKTLSAKNRGPINRNIELLEPPVSRCKQTTETRINRNISATLSTRHGVFYNHSLVLSRAEGPLVTSRFFCNSVPTQISKEPE